MRKKRKLRGREARDAEIAADLASPEVQEALEAEALAEEPDAASLIEPVGDAEAPSGEEGNARASVDFDATTPYIGGDGEEEGAEDAVATAEGSPVGLDDASLAALVESLLFATDKPLTVLRLRQLTHERDAGRIQAALDQLVEHYRDRGIVLHFVAGAYQFRTHPRSSQWVQSLIAGRPVRLSRAQLETLAIVAYRQPITRPEIDDIRGVDSGATLKMLHDRGLIRVLGKKEEPGRPILYGTTKEFLEFFNLNELRDLPTLREYHELSEDSLRVVKGKGYEVPAAANDEVAAPPTVAPETSEHVPGAQEVAVVDAQEVAVVDAQEVAVVDAQEVAAVDALEVAVVDDAHDDLGEAPDGLAGADPESEVN